MDHARRSSRVPRLPAAIQYLTRNFQSPNPKPMARGLTGSPCVCAAWIRFPIERRATTRESIRLEQRCQTYLVRLGECLAGAESNTTAGLQEQTRRAAKAC